MEFPHLRNDTQFPYMNNVDVYSFRNTFDYTRWSEKTKVTLVNVIWNSDYKDVVNFASDANRDAYFDGIKDNYKIELEQAARIVPEGMIKLPIPYDVLARYNYLFIDMPIATSANQPIDWEETNGIRRWYFFIDSIYYRAPNSTEVQLIPDVWTNFHNDVEINYMMLERGHAPVAYSNVDDYLNNPMKNNEYLLAPDVNYADTSIVKSADYIPFGNGTKWLVMISTINPNDITSIGKVTNPTDDTWTNPTYSNTGDRYGYQLQVNGYNFGNAGDYSNLNIPVGNGESDILPNNVTAYAIEASKCYGNQNFLESLRVYNPNFMQSILSAFVVSEDMITFENSYTLANFTVRTIKGKQTSVDFKLTKSMFNFPKEYANFAKLYTFPYSYIELTDNDGRKINVKVEETNNIRCNMISSVAFPLLNIRAFFTGIAGSGSENYTWKRVDGSNVNKTMPNSDWYDYSFDWDIPTYALYMDGKTNYNLHNYNQMQNARRNALVNYHNSVREANTACENAKDLAYTAEANVNADATTLIANMANTTYTERANMNLSLDTMDANNSQSRYYSSEIQGRNNDMVTNDASIANACIIDTTKEENEVSTGTATNSMRGSVQAGAITSTLSAGATVAGLVGSGALTAVSGGFLFPVLAVAGAGAAYCSAESGVANASIITQCNSTVASATRTRNTRGAENTNSTNTGNQGSHRQLNIIQTQNTMDCMDEQQDNTITCQTNNTANTANTMNANAARTRGTSVANSGYTQEVAILNAKETLENAQNRARAIYNDSRNNTPVQIGSYSGSYAPDYMENRGIQIKVRTENDSCIRQVGDMFARYGYALNQIWNVKESGLSLMKHFTYWKASDIWVDDIKASNNSVNNAIERIFLKGVTVWNNPDEIGRVSIYAN